jgi:glucose/arabinose dehydrogenase
MNLKSSNHVKFLHFISLFALMLIGINTSFAQEDATEEPVEASTEEMMMTEEAGGEATEEMSDGEVVTMRDAAPDPANVVLEPVADGFSYPLYLTYAPDGSGRLFVLQQTGEILILQDGETLPTPFLDLSDQVSQDILNGYSERGLLGIAFHPDYANNGLFFVNYTDQNGGTTHVARFRVSAEDPNVADDASEETLMTIQQPFPNHNGGQMAFGPDGYLYISVGDGGSADDPRETGQDPSDLLGSLLRIDVNVEENGNLYGIPEDNPVSSNSEFAPEVWAYGLRNVWRFSFDRATDDLYVADVGQNVWEEVNLIPAGTPGGMNFGWDDFEGSHPFEAQTAPEGMIYPFAEYEHGSAGCSVTGGYVYRGAAVSELDGVYLFGDYCSGYIWASYRDSSDTWQTNMFLEPGFQISSFGEDENGEIYVIDYGGQILRFVAPS